MGSVLLVVAAFLLAVKNGTAQVVFGSPEPDGRNVSLAEFVAVSVLVPAVILGLAFVLRRDRVAERALTGFVCATGALAVQAVVVLGTRDDSAGSQGFFVLPVIWAAFYLRPLGFAIIAGASAAVMVAVALVVTPGGVAGGALYLVAAVLTTGVLIFRERRATEITERLLELQANTDALTGLSSRRVLDGELAEALAGEDASGASLIVVDVDHFKSINDLGGHLAGDTVLRAVGSVIAQAAGPADVACRMGGDEFALLVRGRPDEEAVAVAERLCADVREIPAPPGSGPARDGRMSISVGVAHAPADAGGVEELYEVADRRLYAAKARGRGRVVVADRAG